MENPSNSGLIKGLEIRVIGDSKLPKTMGSWEAEGSLIGEATSSYFSSSSLGIALIPCYESWNPKGKGHSDPQERVNIHVGDTQRLITEWIRFDKR